MVDRAGHIIPAYHCVFMAWFVKSPGINARPLTSPIIIQLYTMNWMAYNEIKSSPLLSCRQHSQSTAAGKTMERSVCHYCILLKLQNNYIQIINIWCAYSASDL